MIQEIAVPSVGESITSGILTTWLKKTGDFVEQEEELFELETDKATVSVPSPQEGILTTLVEENQEVSVGQVVGKLDTEGRKKEPPPEQAAGFRPNAGFRQGAESLSPAVRRVVAEHQLDPAAIRGTGKGGRITKADALQTAAAQERQRTESTPPVAEKHEPVSKLGDRKQTRESMSPIRQRIAARLVEATQNTAHLTTFNEVDMGEVVHLRTIYRESFEKEHGIRLGFMSFFLKACCQALSLFPKVNARIENTDIVYNHYYDIGVAVSTDRGLVVPVIRDADHVDFAEIEKQIASFALRARQKKLGPDELSGGTFTITNGGIFGSLLSTPIINYPQTAILGMHAIQKRPVVRDDEIVIRSMMYVALSYDHRLIDGREAVQFLVKVKQLIEDPRRMLLKV